MMEILRLLCMYCLMILGCQCKKVKHHEIGSKCEWLTSNGYSLDLSELYGSTVEYTDPLTKMKYIYTPCNDGVTCEQNNTNAEYMAIQENINGFCVAYLAKFHGTFCYKHFKIYLFNSYIFTIYVLFTHTHNTEYITPVYSTNDESFTFEYFNGEKSGICDKNREFIIEWKCSDDKESLYKVLSATEVVSCIYLMEIESYLACANSSTITTTTTNTPHECMFGIYDYTDSSNYYIVVNGWTLLTIDKLNDLQSQFIDYYNNNNGIPVLLSWHADDCCLTFGDYSFWGIRTIYESSNYSDYKICPEEVDYDFGCNLTFDFYKNTSYVIDRVHTNTCFLSLNSSVDIFTAQNIALCTSERHNPGIYVKNC